MLTMEDFDRSRIDLHGLRILLQIFNTGSLTAAAEATGLTQSTLSHTLARMRQAFGDPLFVRQGRGVVPTERCASMIPDLLDLSQRMEELVRPRSFDPQRSTRVIRLCCNYYERCVLLPALVARLSAIAPGMRVQIITAESTGHRTLLEGRADLLISPVITDRSGTMTRRLFDDRYVCILRADDPRRRGLSLEDYRKARHVVINYDHGWTPFYITHLRTLGIELQPVVNLPSFGAVRELMMLGGFVMTVPSRLAPQFAPDCLAVAAPFDVRFDLNLYWTQRMHQDPFLRWLRGLLVEIASAVAR